MAVQQNTLAKSRRERRYHTGFLVRCTEAEKQEIFARAEQAHRSASRFLVETAIRNGDGIASRPSQAELLALEGLMVQLRRLASNLQDLASRQHALADDDGPPPDEIGEAVIEVRGILDLVRSRLA